MKKFIVTTTINPPTEAIKLFDAMEDWHLVVIGDLKTPSDFKLERGTYIPPVQQDTLGFDCVKMIPWNVIQRRNIGYLFALREGADVIASVDDDNIPLSDWGKGIEFPMRSSRPWLTADLVVDPLYLHEIYFRERDHPGLKLWHRGFPVQLLEKRQTHDLVQGGESDIDVVADLWNGDPDVDAVCRLAHGPFDLRFSSNRESIMGVYAPFNTQNTFFSRRVAPCMCLPYDIGRMDDIWASYMTQTVMQRLNTRVLFRGPTVRQERNPHDLSKDLEKEVIGYRHTLSLLERLASLHLEKGSVPELYAEVVAGIYGLPFISEEMHRFQQAWINDVARLV